MKDLWVLDHPTDSCRYVAEVYGDEVSISQQGIAEKGAHDEGQWVQAYDGPVQVMLSQKALLELVRVTPEILQVICGPSEQS